MSDEQKVFLKPKEKGLKIHDGQGGRVPEEGKDYVLTKFLRRRINDGDLIDIEAEKIKKELAKKEAAEKKAAAKKSKS